ncbi:MAG: hypothetical protein ABEI06_04435 [Halobacteriaceae archaeon]
MIGATDSILDEDTAEGLTNARETLEAVLSSAQRDLQKVFIIFLIGFLSSFYLMRAWVWPFLRADLLAMVQLSLP